MPPIFYIDLCSCLKKFVWSNFGFTFPGTTVIEFAFKFHTRNLGHEKTLKISMLKVQNHPKMPFFGSKFSSKLKNIDTVEFLIQFYP